MTEKIEELMPDSDDDKIIAAYDAAMRQRSSRVPENMLYLLQNNAKEIERNRLQALIRRRNHASGGSSMCDLIDDRFYSVLTYPNYILKIMVSPNFKYKQRLALACFFVGNGLIDSEFAMNIFKFYNTHWQTSQLWNKRFTEFRDLFNYLNKPINDPDSVRIRSQYFYFSMEAQLTLHLDGSVRKL